MSQNLQNKIAVVTGAGGGMGGILVRQLEKAGVICILIERNMELLAPLLATIDADKHHCFTCDFSKVEEVVALSEMLTTKFSQIDFLYNVAGIGIYKNLEDLSITEWNNSLMINLTAPLVLTKGLLSSLKKSDSSMVLNFGSGMGMMPTAGRVAYCTSKFGLRGMSLTLSKEFKELGIAVVHMTLGSVMTNFGTGGLAVRQELQEKGKEYLDPNDVIAKVMEITQSEQREDECVMYPGGYAT